MIFLKTFYHVSDDFKFEISTFKPRIPERPMKAENLELTRVCISDSLENCVMAHPTLRFYLGDRDGDTYWFTQVSKTSLSKNVRGLVTALYTFELEENELIDPSFLKSKEWVPDALETGEYWSFNNIKPVNRQILVIHSFSSNDEVNSFKYSIFDSIEELMPLVSCEFLFHISDVDNEFYNVYFYSKT